MSHPEDTPIFRIRRMAPDDLDQVIVIDQLSFSQPWSAQSFQFEMFNNPVARMWVAEKMPETTPPVIVGMMVIWMVIDEAHIGTIAVHPDFRRNGIGKQLLHQGLKQLQSEGANMVFLEVRRSNTCAQNLYHDFGFSKYDERKGYYQDNGEDALIFVLDHLPTRSFNG